MADHILRVVYDEKILKRGVRAFIWYRVTRGIGWLGLAALALIAVSFLSADRLGWVQNLALAVLVLSALGVAVAYSSNMHVKLSRFRRMPDPAVTMTLRQDGFEVASSLGTSSLPWSYLTGMLAKPDFWLLFGSGADFIVLPLKGIPEESLACLKQNIAVKK